MEKNEFEWTDDEMGSEASAIGGEELKRKNISFDNPTGKKLPLEFNLLYSFPEPNGRGNGKNILFIPGGPGTIPRLNQEADNRLELLEELKHNVAYFHVRGSGRSRIDPSNKYDRFLRADYVVEDIERLRLQLNLRGNNGPWDAIWGESHGALIAQKYAYKYGTDKVKKLILVGPPSRSDETHDPRRKMMVSNLEAILRYYADFSFLTPQMINAIIYKLETKLKKLEEEYGSINFVTENYDDLLLGYPLVDSPPEFFKALKYLSFHGRPVQGLKFEDPSRQINAGLLIANELMLAPRDPSTPEEHTQKSLAPIFLSHLNQDSIDASRRLNKAQTRLNEAHANIAGETSLKSERAYWVFGVFDGISRWILEFMKDKVNRDGFFRTEDIAASLTGASRSFAEKIGMVPGEPIYPWNPGYYRHNVPTLILKGGADAVIAGGQAESFYKDGLSNKRDSVLMEIPGMGHIWNFSIPVGTVEGKEKKGRDVLQELAKEFLKQDSAFKFREDRQVSDIVESLGISVLGAPQPKGDKLVKLKIDKPQTRKVLATAMRLRRERNAASGEKHRKARAKAPKTKSSRPRPNN
jgi:pimeloyl-ACP methyl ester carboxylesterase